MTLTNLKKENKDFKVDRTKSGRERYVLDGKPLTGVTTITNMQNKGFLVPWAAKEAYTHCLTLTKSEIQDVIKNKAYAYKNKSKHATDKGTLAHDYVERFINNYIAQKKYIREEIEDDEVRNSVTRFYDWAEEKKVEFLASEIAVYSRKFWYAGTFDFVCRIDGKLLLGDFKTSKQIDETYFGQAAGYVIAIEEHNPEHKFDGVIIVRSTLSEHEQVWYEKSSSGSWKRKVNEPFEVKLSYNLEREKAYFLSLLNIYRYQRSQDVKEWYEAEVIDYNGDDYPVEENN